MRVHASLALAISASLHLALLAAWSAVSLAPRPATPGPTLESQVVHVHLAPPAKGSGERRNADMPHAPPAGQRHLPALFLQRVERSPAERPPVTQPAEVVIQASAGDDATSPTPASSATAAPAATAAPERAAAVAPQPVHAAETPAYLSTPELEYPRSAREDEQEGLVVLRVLVSRDGLPAEIRIARSSGFRALDAAAVAGVKRWTFSPATSDQRRIDAWMDVPVRFRLE